MKASIKTTPDILSYLAALQAPITPELQRALNTCVIAIMAKKLP